MRILIAEKDKALMDLVKTRLEVRGFEVFDASDTVEALHLLDKEKFDLILLSSEMERIGPSLLIELIRQRPRLAAVPVILLTGEGRIAELVMSRTRGYDDFLTKPFDPLALQLRVALNVERSKQRAEANALTQLPGNPAIEKVIRKKIESGEKFSVLYIDINHFKAFNDYYSFEKGDDVIRQTAKILIDTAHAVAGGGDFFVGHIGGDDFIVVLEPDLEEPFARSFIASFDQIIPTYYNEEDRKRGSIRVTNRRGKRESFPVMSCAVAAVTNLHKIYRNLGEIARDTMEVKAFLKSQQGSHYLRDRRSEPLPGAAEALQVLSPALEEKTGEEDLAPLGQILLEKKLITPEQLSAALKEHLESGRKLGQVLVAMKAVRSEEVGKILEKKLNVTYVNLDHFTPSADLLKLFTRDFVKRYQVVPLEREVHSLRVGMCNPFDVQSLNAVKRLSGLEPLPVLILESEFETFWARYENQFQVKKNVG